MVTLLEMQYRHIFGRSEFNYSKLSQESLPDLNTGTPEQETGVLLTEL